MAQIRAYEPPWVKHGFDFTQTNPQYRPVSGMNRKCAHAWMAWLLPALVLRSLIPVGFMPMFGPGQRVQLVLCESYGPVPSMPGSDPTQMPQDMAMVAGMDMSHAAQGGQTRHGGSHQDHGLCLFGSSPALGAPLAFFPSTVTLQPTTPLPTAFPQLSHYKALFRAQSARGPPV